jgi:hypothetical protein
MKVGITGHQLLGSEETVKWLESTLKECIEQYNIDQGITSLAIGADQLYAEILRKKHLSYSVIIPCKGYETTFQNDHDRKMYQELLQNAFETIQLPFDEPCETAYYEAGKQVVNSSDIMLAIWNGLPAKGLGGTGDIVQYALSVVKRVIHINPITREVSIL